MHNEGMPNVQVRNVPEATHRALQRRAEQAGQSLQQYLYAQLTLLAETPPMDEVLDRIEQGDLGVVSAHDAIAALRDERARR